MREIGPVNKSLSGDPDTAAAQVSVARTQLGILKNLMKLGGLKIGSRTVRLADGTTIQVASFNGQDFINIETAVPVNTPPVDVPVGIPTEDVSVPPYIPTFDACLLVIFNNNEVAAIPMSAINGAALPVIYRGKIKHAVPSWQVVAQYNFGVPGCDSVFLAPFAVLDNVLTVDPSNYWLNAIRTNNGTDANCLHAVQTGASSSSDPILNASGATIYTPDGTYGVVKAVPALQQSYLSAFGASYPRAIGPDGTYYFEAQFYRRPSNWTPAPPANLVLLSAAMRFGGSGGGLPANVTAIGQITNTSQNDAWAISEVYRSGASFTYKVVTNDYGGNPDYSMAVPVAVYRGGFTDQLGMQTLQANATEALVESGALAGINAAQSILDWSETGTWTATLTGGSAWTFTMQDSGFNSINILSFPPALSGTQLYAFAQDTANNSATKTPYFTSSDYGCYGWAHLSNGPHVLQAFFTSNAAPVDTPHLYIDGVDARGKLEAALGVSLLNVQVMLFDIPLAAIQRMT